MARKALRIKQQRLEEKRQLYAAKKEKMPWISKHYNRCRVCWRIKSYIREFWVCRVCFRNYAREGLIMWVKKASW